MLCLCFCEVAVIEMGQHYVHSAYRFEIPGIAAVDSLNCLHRIWIFPKVPVAHNAAVVVAEVLSVTMVLVPTVIRHYAGISKEGVALVHVCLEIVIAVEGIALHQGTCWIFLEEVVVAG